MQCCLSFMCMDVVFSVTGGKQLTKEVVGFPFPFSLPKISSFVSESKHYFAALSTVYIHSFIHPILYFGSIFIALSDPSL